MEDFNNLLKNYLQDSQSYRKFVELLMENIYPLMLRIRSHMQVITERDDIAKIQDVYWLCCSQIKKCTMHLFDTFKLESRQQILLQESRQCILDRLSWCVNRLFSMENHLKELAEGSEIEDNTNNSMTLAIPMYFVNWIDHAFEILNKLAVVVYKTDYKESQELFDKWKNDIVECVTSLQVSLDELLLSAMTLCKYCMPEDQHVVKTRCQVVLREAKVLLSELIVGNLDDVFKVTAKSLKLPIMPSNVNILIDVLKDVLYVLETNTNSALLSLLVDCFSKSVSPVDILKDHFMGNSMCHININNVTEECSFVKEFDLYNERVLQVGSFAMSCSSDLNRVLVLRSGLASLEALDPHLVPAVMLSPDSCHSKLLMNIWHQEVQEIKNNIFLIVEPSAFAKISKQIMHLKLLSVTKENSHKNTDRCAVINIGCMVCDFFNIYIKHEPDALSEREKLVPLLANLDKVQLECKIVNNLFSAADEFMYQVKNPKINKKPSFDKLLKRLKLLYTLVGKIESLVQLKGNDEHMHDALEEPVPINNMTYTMPVNNDNTYIKKPINVSRSTFARTTNARSSINNFPLSKLTKHMNAKKRMELSFSVQLNEVNNDHNSGDGKLIVNKHLDNVREHSMFYYNISPNKNRSSLRKAVLSRRCNLPSEKEQVDVDCLEKPSLMHETTNLQITDILDQMIDMTSFTSARAVTHVNQDKSNSQTKINTEDLLEVGINNTASMSNNVWHMTVTSDGVDKGLDDNVTINMSNATQPSNVTTFERINDLDLVESKLNNLKSLTETKL